MTTSRRIQVIDTHTGGEPTRVVVAGGPDLGAGTLAERRALFRQAHDPCRSAVVNEPRGSDVMVGALLLPPADPSCVAGVIFFNNVGYLGMCGHGTIGVAVALGHLGRIGAGTHRLETPVGVVTIDYDGGDGVSFENVPSYRHRADVAVNLDEGVVRGDVAWGGNWFFLVDVEKHERLTPHLGLDALADLVSFTVRLRRALNLEGVTDADGAEIDHVELFGPSTAGADGKNFVLCPGLAYDRSPCGTGTSAKLACLAADGKLEPGRTWRQESIIGSVFEASYRRAEGEHIVPRISGTAYVNGEATLIIDPRDLFAWGIRSGS
jgi:4-hydroxyproline epimerase